MSERPFDKIRAGLLDALAHARGEPTGCIVHTPEDILRRRKERHRERAKLSVVPAVERPKAEGGDSDG